MGKFNNLYNVYDMERKEVIICNASAGELAKRFKKNSNYISKAAAEDITIRGKYKVYISSDSFEREWKNITKKLLLYREIIRKIQIIPEPKEEFE